MFIRAYGSCSVVAEGHPWAHESQRYAWVREIRDLVEGELADDAAQLPLFA